VSINPPLITLHESPLAAHRRTATGWSGYLCGLLLALGQGEAFVDLGYLTADGGEDLGVVFVAEGFVNPVCYLHHFGFFHAAGSDGWGAYADTAAEGDLFCVKGDAVFVHGDACVVEGLAGYFAVEAFGA
jgi:hypothetical protein